MRRIVALILTTLLPSLAVAQSYKQNEAQSTIYGTAGQVGPHTSVDSKGNLMCSLTAGTAGAANPIGLEDTPHTSGDAGVVGLGVNNRSLAAFNTTQLDRTPFGVGDYGNQFSSLLYDASLGNQSPIIKEDAAADSADPLVAIAFKRVDQIGTASEASATGDYVHPRANNFDAIWTQLSAGNYTGSIKTSIVSAATNNAQTVSGGQTALFGLIACNNTTVLKYVKLYNKNGTPSCGVDTVVHTVMVPKENCVTEPLVPGIDFSSGLSLCMVANMVATDNTAIGANEVSVSLVYR